MQAGRDSAYVREKIERGMDAVKNGQTTSQADAEERLSPWLGE
jgi:cell division protein FtsX